MTDIPMLRKYVEWVEEQEALPESKRTWYQGEYVTGEGFWKLMEKLRTRKKAMQITAAQAIECGTKLCYCGKLAVDHGAVIRITGYQWDGNVVTFDGMNPDVYGARLLDITEQQACRLFHGGNSAALIREIAESIAGERL